MTTVTGANTGVPWRATKSATVASSMRTSSSLRPRAGCGAAVGATTSEGVGGLTVCETTLSDEREGNRIATADGGWHARDRGV
jgi:hypothetical protein